MIWVYDFIKGGSMKAEGGSGIFLNAIDVAFGDIPNADTIALLDNSTSSFRLPPFAFPITGV